MFSRVLKAQTDKFLSPSNNNASTGSSASSSTSTTPIPSSPAKSASTSSDKRASAPQSKIPVPREGRAKENEGEERYASPHGQGQATQGWTGYVPTSQQQHSDRERERDHARSERVPVPISSGTTGRDSIRTPPPPPSPAAQATFDDVHMMTVNPGFVGTDTLAALRGLPADAPAGGATEGDVRMQTVHRGVPAELKAALASPMPGRSAAPAPAPPQQQQQQATPRAKQSYIPTRTAPPTPNTQPVQQVQQPPAQLQLWEREILASAEVKRKATLAQLYFLDYYFDLLGYLHARKGRLQGFKADTASRKISSDAYAKEFASYAGRERVVLRKRRTKLRVEQFRIIAQVGQGGYGSVYLARKADTGQVCALKKMKKTTLAKMDEVKHVLVERDILTATKTPWLVRLLYAFQDRDHVYLAMEYVPGGDFRTLLNNSGVLKEEHARFYSAEMFAGVNELHKLGYIHRDLKPENFLVAGDGHVKLTDFGLATGALNPMKIESMKQKLDQVKDENLIYRSTLERRTMYKSMRMAEPRYADSVVGSPDYMPPEVLRGRTYTFSADYWSLGCILFEFLCGFPPFSGGTPEETWANLKNWQKVLRRPIYDKPEDLIFNLTDPAWDAITRLIAHPKERVASLHEVQSMPFFNRLPFSKLRDIPAPFVPMLESDSDVGYFDAFDSPEDMAKYAEVFKKQADVDAVAEKGMGSRQAWIGFTFGKNSNIPMPPASRKPDGEALQTMF